MAIMNVDRWLWRRTLWRWENEATVNRLARQSIRRENRMRRQRGNWRM